MTAFFYISLVVTLVMVMMVTLVVEAAPAVLVWVVFFAVSDIVVSSP